MRACVFVDGENFRHSIGGLFPQFQQQDYLPKRANWAGLFDWIVENVVAQGERIRTYWYVTKSIDFFPYRFPDPSRTPHPEVAKAELQTLLSKHKPYREELEALDETSRATRMEAIVSTLTQRQEDLTRRFSGWVAVQDAIAMGHKAIEFRRAGNIKCTLFDSEFGREKAVDVKLACDMIMLKDIYDIAIIVSGDQDYVPAVEVIKDWGKRVVNVAFQTRRGDLLPGGARRLNQVTDWSFNIPYNALAQHLNIPLAPSP